MAKLLNLETSEKPLRLYSIGRIIKVHGIKGKLKVNVIPELSPFISDISEIFIENRKYSVVSFSVFRKNLFILTLAEIDNAELAQGLPGKEILISEKIIAEETRENIFDIEDLEGFEVMNENNTPLGRIKDFYKTPHCSYIELESGKLIPFIRQHIKKIEPDKRKVIVIWNE